MLEEIFNDAGDAIDRYGEAQPDGATARRVDRAVHANDLTIGVDQRTAGIARIDGGVGLDHVEVRGRPLGASHEVPTRAADDTCRNARLWIPEKESIWISDGDRPFTDEQVVGIADLGHGQGIRVDLDDGEIVGLVGPENLGRKCLAVSHHHRNACRAGNDMRVGDDDTIWPDYEAGAQTSRAL